MGGDDLGSDDEYLDSSFLHSDNVAPNGESEPEEEEEYVGRKSRNKQLQQKKRSRSNGDGTDRNEGGGAEEDEPSGGELPSPKKRRSKGGPQRNLLLESGRGIAEQAQDVQSAFLWTCFTHSLKMGGEDPENEGVEKFQPTDFYSPPTKVSGKGGKKSPDSAKAKSMATFLKGGALSSSKRLKKWKVHGSPMVLIVCASARRAVAILKQLAPLNVRCAKLFAKHMDVEEQIEMLKSSTYGIAVGTPNRLLKLFETGGEGGRGALSLDETELLVIDNHEDHKKFTVCTLNDTAPDLMKFIRRAAIPQMQKRKSFKFAMF